MKILFFITLLLFPSFNFRAEEVSPNDRTFAIDSFRRLPVQHEGRIKPLDTVARYSLLLLHGSQSLHYQGKKLKPGEWLLEVFMNPKTSKAIKLIRIDNHDLLGMIGKESKSIAYYSISELEPLFKDIFHQYSEALTVEENQRDSFQRAVIVLWKQIATFLSLSNSLWVSGIENVLQELDAFEHEVVNEDLLFKGADKNRFEWFKQRYQFLADAAYFNVLYPQSDDEDQNKWLNMGEGLLGRVSNKSFHPGIKSYARMISAYQKGDVYSFNKNVNNYLNDFKTSFPELNHRITFEILYNDFQPFFVSSIIYVLVLLFSVLSWIIWPRTLKALSLSLFILGFVTHSFGLISRMIIEARPPVTNLFSSVVFVGWGAVAFSFILERILRHCIGCIVGAVIGSLTLIVALHMVGTGDTMEVMRAVLDSNFWLSTHVVTITLGYSSSFLAGGLASLFIIRGHLNKSLNKEISKKLNNMVYGVVCFSTLLTFVGTVLGGIWADQSWGRFWGWDPKENGALMIILWNVFILHARVGGFVKERGLMVMAVFGNVVTSLSWFGVNLLGTGLHSYGFMEGAFFPLAIFVISQLLIMCLGVLPKHMWRSREHFS